jgi:Cu/Ag efflux protein CusF
MWRTLMAVGLAALLLDACGPGRGAAEKRYPVSAEVVALDRGAQLATLKHGKIGDWMEAMTMAYPVKPESEFLKLQVGARVEATVVVHGGDYYVTAVKVAAR